MICIVTQHFNLNRICLMLIGLWPYECSKLVRFQTFFCFTILISSVVYQFTVFVFTKCTVDTAIKVLSAALYVAMCTIQYNSFRINIHIVKQLLDELDHIFKELTDENEITILKEYGKTAERFTIIIMMINCVNLTSLILMPIVAYIPGNIFINEARLQHVVQNMMPAYFVNEKQYWHIILLHLILVGIIGGSAVVATGMMLVGYFEHACGMFKIASYRIKKALMTNVKSVKLKDEIIIHKEIILAIDIHRKAIKFSQYMFSNFQGSHFWLLIVGVVCLSLNLYGISETMLTNDVEQFITHFVFISATFVYFFIANYIGQKVTNHNEHVFFTVYNVRWYVASLHVQKLILFLLQRGTKTVYLYLGGIFMLSFELLATLMKASISYFTVVYSTQK
ncbi:hypothetical protein PUN28_018795 [Cardiocondyla obscurior]|uniref:Odorant receptor n=9 Tax=Cardiocondyla obscurior TaxID=286306 RepID=A0AAW2EER5_9HYME